MSSAKVTTRRVDLTTRVPSFPGVSGGICFPAVRGSINEKPVLVSGESDLLKKFTPEGRIEVGYDLGYFSALTFLKKSNKLYVKRVVKNARFGYAIIGANLSAVNNSPSTDIVSSSIFTVTSGNAILTDITLFDKLQNGYAIQHTVTGGATATGLIANSIYYIRKGVSPTITLFTTKANALANTSPITITNDAVGIMSLAYTNVAGMLDPTAYNFNTDEALILYGSDPGVWNNNNIVITITDNSNKEPDSFRLRVFRPTNTNIPIDGEDFICSRKHKLDGYGNNIFIEDVLKQSNYIRCISNVAVSESVQPKFTTVGSTLGFGGGTDGDSVTDFEMINALNQAFSNKDSIFVTVIMDAGWATPSYAQAIAELCKHRDDCVGCLSVPISAELSSSYMDDIIAYRASLASLIPEDLAPYVALYSCHQQISDKFNGNRKIFISPDGFAGGAISFSAANYEIWYPPAGWKRGGISANKPARDFNETERDVLYDAGINPTRYKELKGIAIWGQKTLLARPSALDRLNVQLLLIYISPAINELLDNYTFDLANPGDRSQIVIIISNFMKRVKSRLGVYSFDVVADSRNNTNDDIDNHKFNVWLIVQPTQSQENTDLSLVITKTGDSLNTTLSLLGGN